MFFKAHQHESDFQFLLIIWEWCSIWECYQSRDPTLFHNQCWDQYLDWLNFLRIDRDRCQDWEVEREVIDLWKWNVFWISPSRTITTAVPVHQFLGFHPEESRSRIVSPTVYEIEMRYIDKNWLSQEWFLFWVSLYAKF